MNKVDTLILGNIVTLDLRNPILEAICVRNGKVIYCGSKRIAKAMCDSKTKIIDYKKNYVYPGFMDAHCHGFYAGSKLAYFQTLVGKSLKDYIDIMVQRMKKDPSAPFYCGMGFVVRKEQPNHNMLDKICKIKPMILISIDGHSVWLNKKAMEVYQINKEAVKHYGSDIVRVDKNGEPTGYISEGPTTKITGSLCTTNVKSIKKAILVWQEFALKEGYTAYYEAGINEMVAKAYNELAKEGKLKLKCFAGWLIDENEKDYVKCVKHAKSMVNKYNYGNFQIIGVKIFMDGVVEAHTAWLDKPYTDQPNYYGVKRFHNFKKTCQLYREANKLGLNVHQHCIGDGATKFALDCIEKVQTETGNMDMRNAIAHLQVVRKEDIKRICDLNVMAVVAPLWMCKDPDYFFNSIKYMGVKRTFYNYPLASFLNNNGMIAFHTDYPVSPQTSGALSIYMACKRNNPHKDLYLQMSPSECLDRMSAISGLTIGPAYSFKQEDHLGQLMIGYQANMTIFDKDFVHSDIEEIANAKHIATVIDGKEEYHG